MQLNHWECHSLAKNNNRFMHLIKQLMPLDIRPQACPIYVSPQRHSPTICWVHLEVRKTRAFGAWRFGIDVNARCHYGTKPENWVSQASVVRAHLLGNDEDSQILTALAMGQSSFTHASFHSKAWGPACVSQLLLLGRVLSSTRQIASRVCSF